MAQWLEELSAGTFGLVAAGWAQQPRVGTGHGMQQHIALVGLGGGQAEVDPTSVADLGRSAHGRARTAHCEQVFRRSLVRRVRGEGVWIGIHEGLRARHRLSAAKPRLATLHCRHTMLESCIAEERGARA
jgi:hypothetical protein